MTTYIQGHKVTITEHAAERAIKRFKSLSIVFNKDEDYVYLAISAIGKMLENPFMDKYLYNLTLNSKHHNEDVLVYDEVNKMVYALAVKPYQSGRIIVKTIGTEHDDEWLYQDKYQRLCWIYKDAFKFSTINGNVSWY